jgi:hypothetical protein
MGHAGVSKSSVACWTCCLAGSRTMHGDLSHNRPAESRLGSQGTAWPPSRVADDWAICQSPRIHSRPPMPLKIARSLTLAQPHGTRFVSSTNEMRVIAAAMQMAGRRSQPVAFSASRLLPIIVARRGSSPSNGSRPTCVAWWLRPEPAVTPCSR